jgi:hypothetical protein
LCFGTQNANHGFVKTKLLSLMLLAAGAVFGQISIGISIGPPPPPRVYRVRPVAPAPGFVWVDGYWYPQGHKYRWHDGYWTRVPYAGAAWIGPRYDGGRFYEGYWQGPRGDFKHDHKWDKKRERDWDRGDGHDNGRGRGKGHDKH